MAIFIISGDNSSFLVFNRDPVDQMISYLNTNFPSSLPADSPRSLCIRSGYKGARLSHPHSQQYQYCLQTLTLWREIQVMSTGAKQITKNHLFSRANFDSFIKLPA